MTPSPSRPALAITLGDPGGIGPEVVAKALADPSLRSRGDYVMFGPRAPLLDACARAGIRPFWAESREAPDRVRGCVLVPVDSEGGFARSAHAVNGRASLDSLDAAIALAHRGVVRGVVTAPISKEAWHLAGETRYPGHTELFAERFGAREFRMMFDSPRLRVILATTHIPLREVAPSLTSELVLTTIRLGHETCQRLGVAGARLGVCGLNPHAGEHGILGREDDEIIRPAIAHARSLGIHATGPFPGDTIFGRAVRGEFDLVVAMYHDQGLIPLKLLAFDSAVNMTVGLPVVRTSPDHGTAFDIAGEGKADAGSMSAAIHLAARLAGEDGA